MVRSGKKYNISSWSPALIAAIYFVFGFLWIIFSDRLVEKMGPDTDQITELQTYKGIFFILISTLIIFLLVYREIKRKNKVIRFLFQSEQRYQKLNQSLPETEVYLYDKRLLSLLPEYTDYLELRHIKKWEPEKYITGIFGEKHSGAVSSLAHKVFSGEESKGEIKVDERYYEMRCSPLTDPEGNVEHGIAVVIDITSHKRKEIELKDRNLFVEMIMDSVLVGLAVRYKGDKEFSYMNREFQLIHRWPEQVIWDIGSYTDHIIIDAEKKKEIYNTLMSNTIPNKGIKEWKEVEIAQNEGKSSIVYMRVIDLPLQGFIIFNVQDITDLKQTQKELLEAKESAEESDRLKSAFLANMSHEIRTPLNSLIGFSELIADGNYTASNHAYYAKIIRQNGDYLAKIINDMINMAKIESQEFRLQESEVNLNRLMERTFLWLSGSELYDHSQIQLEYRNGMPDEKSYMLLDEVHVEEVLQHLLLNAAKYTKKGRISFSYHLNDSYVRFEVQDTGAGVSPEHQQRIFDRFNQLEEANPANFAGTGLGLTICKYIVELMKGNIGINSTPGKGSTFYFTIPYKVAKKKIT